MSEETVIQETPQPEPVTEQQPAGRVEKVDADKSRDKSTRDIIRAAIKEHAEPKPKEPEKKEAKPEPQTAGERARDEQGRFARAEGEAPQTQAAPEQPTAEIPTTEKPAQATSEAPQAPKSEPPAGWSSETKALWSSLPASIQAEVAKREADMQKGVEKLKQEHQQQIERYQEFERVAAPHRQRYAQHGLRSDAEAFNRLLQWENWIRSNPHQAISSLAQQYGVNLATQANPTGQPGQQDQQQTETPPWLRNFMDQFGSLSQKVESVTSDLDRERQTRAANEISTWAKDKPHFEKVRVDMGLMMKQAAEIGKPITLDDAYQRATWANEQIRAEILKEQDAAREKERQDKAKAAEQARLKTEADRKAAEEAKRKATVSPKGGSPTGSSAKSRKAHSHSVRDSILAAKAGLDGRA